MAAHVRGLDRVLALLGMASDPGPSQPAACCSAWARGSQLAEVAGRVQ